MDATCQCRIHRTLVKVGSEVFDKYARATVNPFKPPELEQPPASRSQVTVIAKTTPYAELKAAYDKRQAWTHQPLALHSMLYAISREGKSDVTGSFSQVKDPGQTRAQLAGAMRKLLADIEQTDERVKSNEQWPSHAASTEPCVADFRERNVTPHVTQNTSGRRSAIDRQPPATLDIPSVSESARGLKNRRLDENHWWLPTDAPSRTGQDPMPG